MGRAWKIRKEEEGTERGGGHGGGNLCPSHSSVISLYSLNCLVERVTFACFERSKKYSVCLYREHLPESDGGGTVPGDVGRSLRRAGSLCRAQRFCGSTAKRSRSRGPGGPPN